MTQYNKSTLATFFQTNDIPTGTDYANFIDSYVNVVETTVQSMAGALATTELIATRVSATTLNCSVLTNDSSNFVITAGNRILIQTSSDRIDLKSGYDILVSAERDIRIDAERNFNIDVSSGGIALTSVTGDIFLDASAATVDITGRAVFHNTVSAPLIYSVSGFISPTIVVSAAGTTQGAAALLSRAVHRAKGVVDGTTTGFLLPSNRSGLTQYIYNDAVSANLWPCVGGAINALTSNAAFPMAANTLYTIVHIAASAYAVK